MSRYTALRAAYSWIKTPLLVSAPMLNIATAPLAIAVSSAGGLGFLAAGFDVSTLEPRLEEAVSLTKKSPVLQDLYARTGQLPIGVGFINWGADLEAALPLIEKYRPCAVWFFGPRSLPDDLVPWTERVRGLSAGNGATKIWVQVGTVADALAAAQALRPDALVVQGSDAGGHGLVRAASALTLIPEVVDALKERRLGHLPVLAAGGFVDGRGLAAALALGAGGAVMGTRFLASPEANLAAGYRDEILRVSDGGTCTVRSTVYDRVRGIHGWPVRYDGRGVINQSYVDAEAGMSDAENKSLYYQETKKGDSGWGPDGRMTTYAGTGVGLIKETLPAAKIVADVLQEAKETLAHFTVE